MIGMAMRPMALLAAMCLPLAAGFGAPALAGGIEVRPPAPPGGYALPRSASEVGDMDELQDALSERHAADIVLADGVYDHDSVLVPRAPHRLWAEHPGKAVLKTGILFKTGRAARCTASAST